MVILGSFLTIATVFNFVEDFVSKTKPSSELKESLLSNDNPRIDSNGAIGFSSANLTVNIPIEDGHCAPSPTLESNSDNEYEDSTLETAALLVPG